MDDAFDVHNNWQADREPDFKEAAHDYVATLSPLPSLEVERLPNDAAYWRGRYEGFVAALRQTHTPEQLAEMGFV